MDENWNGVGPHRPINLDVGSACRVTYPGMVTIDGKAMAAHQWAHWVYKQHAEGGTCQGKVWNLFLVS